MSHLGVSLPKTFSGSVAVTVHEARWKVGPATLSGFDVTYRFNKLLFGPGADGPYTLLSGQLASSGFRETEVAPVAHAHACTATYTFFLAHPKPFSGDLGGFSQDGATWHVDLDLGVDTTGTGVGNDCGPDLELTGQQFGEPPRIDISITATGTFNAQTGVLSVRGTSTSPANGDAGAQTDSLTGALHGAG